MAQNLTRFDPLREMARIDPFRNIDEFLRDFSMTPSWRGADAAPTIRMDISETDQNYMVKADIPGVKKEDIKIAIDGNQVTVSAEVKEEKDTNTGGMLRSERFYGQQYRSFTLPQEVDDAKAEAKYDSGVLQLTLPKKEGTKRKEIAVK